ncbi:MAG: GNAT family N-acetyltransferase [Armatimonadetes bacterium]|nr:GNAT family N-acetyltransferase [Armatimonadota bacterium]
MTFLPPELKVTFTPEPDGLSTRAELWAEGDAVSRLWILPFTIRVGAAEVRMDGIGGVGTAEERRNKGYARQLLEATVEWMAGRDAALTMLYGIPNFYPKFGYVTAGPEHLLYLPSFPDTPLPEGWQVRPFQTADLPATQRLYEQNTARAVGVVRRLPESGIWSQLRKTAEPNAADSCRVAVNPSGEVSAYAWRGAHFWYIKDKLGPHHPDALVLAEVMADGPAAAETILAVIHAWAGEEARQNGKEIRRILLSLPPEGPIADAARHHHAGFMQNYSLAADSMARVLNVERLLSSLVPELEARYAAAKADFTGALRFRTDIGEATLNVTPERIAVADSAAPLPALNVTTVHMPQTTLARLALGAFPPDDLLARLNPAPEERTRRILATLFPHRHPHMFIPDRY